jgi:tetratricopeptide (TPR) repeat protein
VNTGRTSPRWVAWVAAATLLLAALFFAGRAGWNGWRTRQSERFTESGYQLWQQGRLREAELALESAEQLAPGALRPRLLKARMWLVTGRREEALVAFRALRAVADPVWRGAVTANLHDALIGTACWEELTELALTELAGGSPAGLEWLTAALEAVRLAEPGARIEAVLARGLPHVSGPARLLVEAQGALAAGRVAHARQILARLPVPLSPELGRLAARVWGRAGARAEARLALTRVNRTLTADEQALAALVTAEDDPAAAVAAVRRLLQRAAGGAAEENLLAAGLGLALAQPEPRVAAAFGGGLDRWGDGMLPSLATGVWLLQELSGQEPLAEKWREHLQQRLGCAALPRGFRSPTTNAFRLLVDSVPLRRDLLYGLLAAVPPARISPVPISRERRT